MTPSEGLLALGMWMIGFSRSHGIKFMNMLGKVGVSLEVFTW